MRAPVLPPAASNQIRATPLARENFAPFGRVIELSMLPGERVNEDRGVRRDLPALSREGAFPTTPCSAVYDLEQSVLPFHVRMLERHRLSEQSFMSLDGAACLIAVAPTGADGRPNAGELQAFTGMPGQVVIYAAGTWHAPLVALDRRGSFLMQMWQTGTTEDCELAPLTQGVVVAA